MTKNSSSSSAKFGNTNKLRAKQIPPAKHWEFTLNNYSKADISKIETIDSSIVPIIVGQSEIGDKGTPHLQVTFSYAKKGRPISMFKELLGHARCSFRKVRNISKCREYCSKDETHDKVWRYVRGYKRPRPLATITYDMLKPYQKSIADFFQKPCDPRFSREIYWLWEPQGNMGKTILSAFFVDCRDALVISGKRDNCFYGVMKYMEAHNGAGPDIVIFDVPRSNIDYVSYTAIEKVKDGLFFSGKFESGMVRFNRPHILILANEPPVRDKLSEDRWHVVRYGEDIA